MLPARLHRLPLLAFAVFCFLTVPVAAQSLPASGQESGIRIDLKTALQRARENSPQLQSADISIQLAREDRSQAKAALLPSLNYFNQYFYTQGNGTDSGIFVGNDGVHVYNSQAQVHQELYSPEKLGEYRRTAATQALAAAKRDIVERGLVATVVQSYYETVAAQRRSLNAGLALQEARRFVEITQKLETGGEVARADVLKARLVFQQRQREVQDTLLAADKARIALAVLMFPDYRLDFTLVDDLNSVDPLPAYADFENQAKEKSPELRAAEESVHQEEYNVSIARAAYLPSLALDYFFGINANQFAIHDPEGNNRLGSVAQATLNIPVWNWWITKSKVRQANMQRKQAQLDLVFSQRQYISNLHTLYLEAQSSLAQLDSLRDTMDVSAESLRLTNLRYMAGEVSVLEVVDAQSTLAQARNAYDNGLARYRLAFADIQALTGTI
jgi:outer membrane protein TolC